MVDRLCTTLGTLKFQQLWNSDWVEGVHFWGINVFFLMLLFSFNDMKEKSHGYVYKQFIWVKYPNKMFGQWCILIGLLLFMFGFPLIITFKSGAQYASTSPKFCFKQYYIEHFTNNFIYNYMKILCMLYNQRYANTNQYCLDTQKQLQNNHLRITFCTANTILSYNVKDNICLLSISIIS